MTLAIEKASMPVDLPQNCDLQSEKNQKEVEEFLNAFMPIDTCRESNGVVICSENQRLIVNPAQAQSLGEEIPLTMEQESDLQRRLARFSEIFDLSTENPLSISKDNKVYQFDPQDNIVTEIDLTTHQRKDVALDPNLLVEGFGGSGGLKILNEKGQADFVDFDELFNSGNDTSDNENQDLIENNESNENAVSTGSSPSSGLDLLDLGQDDSRIASPLNQKEMDAQKIEAGLDLINSKLNEILEEIKYRNQKSLLFENAADAIKSTRNPKNEKRVFSGQVRSRTFRSSFFESNRLSSSGNTETFSPSSTPAKASNPDLYLDQSSNLGGSAHSADGSSRNADNYFNEAQPLAGSSNLFTTSDSELDSQVENLASAIFGTDHSGIIKAADSIENLTAENSIQNQTRLINKPAMKLATQESLPTPLNRLQGILERPIGAGTSLKPHHVRLSQSSPENRPNSNYSKSKRERDSKDQPKRSEEPLEFNVLSTLSDPRRKLLTDAPEAA